MCKYVEGTVWTFGYTGAEQEFTVPCDGNYKIEAWGSQGGTSSSRQGVTYIGGYGAYSTGEISLLHERKLYIQVGGNQQKFNGGTGSGENSGNPSGGDSTNILFESTNLSNLKDDKEKIMIVAAGGGGGFGYKTVSTSDYSGSGGNAGGISGNNANRSGLCYWIASGATQTSGGRISYCSGINSSIDGGIKTGQYGSFGVGGNSLGSSGAGGGGGYYGGSFSHYAGGSGGSSYIGNPLLTNKVMYCYNCAQSSDAATKTISNTCTSATPTSNCSKQGNGYAKITYLGE